MHLIRSSPSRTVLPLLALFGASCTFTQAIATDTSISPMRTPDSSTTATATPIPATSTPTLTPTSDPFVGMGKIVFLSRRDGNPEIYVMNADGSQTTRLTNTEAYEGNPSISPDGRLVAFSADYDGANDIYTLALDGSGLARLTTNGRNNFPDWSSDGESIVFNSQRDPVPGHEGPPPEIYIMAADGSNQLRLTFNTTSDTCPSLSPDGQQIAFYSFHYSYSTSRIEIVNRDGSGQRQLVDTPEYDGCPAWSPDGTRIAFASLGEGPPSSIHVISPDGTGLAIMLHDEETVISDVTWSRDGQWLAFTSDLSGNQDIYVLSLDSGELFNVTADSPAHEWAPSFVP